MPMPDPNHRPQMEVEHILQGARFEMSEGFEESLRQHLLARVPARPTRKPPSALRRLFIPQAIAAENVELSMTPSRLTAIFSIGVIGLMLVLFVGLVLMRPSDMAVSPTPTQETYTLTGMRFGDELELTGYEVQHTERTWSIQLFWRPLVKPTRNYSVTLHAASEGVPVAQLDTRLLADDLVSSYSFDVDLPTTAWEPNHLLRSWYMLTISADQPAPDVITISVIDPTTGEALHLWKDGISLSTLGMQLWSTTGTAQDGAQSPTGFEECGPEKRCLSPDGKFWLHRFVNGETIESLAFEYQSSVECILRENDLPPDGYQVFVGTLLKICIPSQLEASGETPIELGNGWRSLAMSADGQWLAAETSPAEGEWPTVYLQHAVTGEMIFVAYGASPSLSSDGRYVAFVIQPRGGEVVNWDRTGIINVYDRVENTYSEVAFDVGIGRAEMPAISGDGQYVAYVAYPSEPIGPQPPQVYVADRHTGVVTGLLAPDTQPGESYNASPTISADGRYVAFSSSLIGDPGSRIVLYDQVEQTTQIVTEGFFPQISGDGMTVAYLLHGGVEGQGEGWINAAAINLRTGDTRWLGRVIDAGPDGMWTEPGPSLSHNGGRIAFRSVLEDPRSSDIAPPPPAEGLGSAYSTSFIFVYDWVTDSVERADPPSGHISPDGNSMNPSISGDGTKVLYLWSKLDRTGSGLYLRDLEADETSAISLSE